MTRNVGNTDRMIRFAIAAVMAILLATKTVAIGSTLGIFMAVLGGISLFTALTNWCAIYALIGASTCPLETN